MNPVARVALLSAATVLIFDVVVATGSRIFGFPYTSVVAGSYLIYFGAGFFGARAGRGVGAGVLTAAAAGLADSTLGWLLSAVIGPGGPPAALAASPGAIAAVVVLVPVLASAIGLCGGLVAHVTRPRRPSPPLSS
jgi:hypothetical protein